MNIDGLMQARSKDLRKNMTAAENRMWYYLRNRRLAGYKFVREQVIGKYIADFVCRDKNLIIEVDGGQHMAAAAYDQQRTEDLEALGYQVLRVWNHEVYDNIQGVMDKILSIIEGGNARMITLIPSPSPLEGEGRNSVG
jgi:very-short-patch-repair endonuclease